MSIGNEPSVPPSSPIFASGEKPLQICRNGLQEDSGVVKILRIPLYRTAVVHVLKAESPSCIWVRLTNHITEKLILTEPCDLTPRCAKGGITDLEVLREFEYCMAPIRDRTYGRCRILECVQMNFCFLFHVYDDIVKIFFIDEGLEAWVAADCLARMPKDFSYHPWQAIMVSLCGVNKRKIPAHRNQDRQMWTAEECISFRQILNKFPFVKTRTVKSSIVHNDYRRAINVELYGIPEGHTDTSPDVGICIAALFAAEQRGRMQNRRIADAALFLSDLNFNKITKPPPLREIPPFRRTFPSDWKLESTSSDQPSNETAMEWRNWSPKTVSVPPLEVEWLHDHGYVTSEGEYLINIEGSQTQSPYEFYARPIKRERVRITPTEDLGVDYEFIEDEQLQSETSAMLSAHDELKKKATILDTFYSLEENRSPLERNQCIEWLSDNIRVFAICACSEERGAYTGEWQRVEVLSCDVFANVLFLDSGGTELVLPHSLYKIHPTHCSYPPMCMQLCMYGVGPSNAIGSTEWGEEAKTLWKKLLREDLPMVIAFIKRLNAADDDKVLHHSAPAWRRPGVLFVQSLRVYGDEVSTLDKFCNADLFPNNGIIIEEMPCRWD